MSMVKRTSGSSHELAERKQNDKALLKAKKYIAAIKRLEEIQLKTDAKWSQLGKSPRGPSCHGKTIPEVDLASSLPLGLEVAMEVKVEDVLPPLHSIGDERRAKRTADDSLFLECFGGTSGAKVGIPKPTAASSSSRRYEKPAGRSTAPKAYTAEPPIRPGTSSRRASHAAAAAVVLGDSTGKRQKKLCREKPAALLSKKQTEDADDTTESTAAPADASPSTASEAAELPLKTKQQPGGIAQAAAPAKAPAAAKAEASAADSSPPWPSGRQRVRSKSQPKGYWRTVVPHEAPDPDSREYVVKGFLNLKMNLKLSQRYSLAELKRRCKGDEKRLSKLEECLSNPELLVAVDPSEQQMEPLPSTAPEGPQAMHPAATGPDVPEPEAPEAEAPAAEVDDAETAGLLPLNVDDSADTTSQVESLIMTTSAADALRTEEPVQDVTPTGRFLQDQLVWMDAKKLRMGKTVGQSRLARIVAYKRQRSWRPSKEAGRMFTVKVQTIENMQPAAEEWVPEDALKPFVMSRDHGRLFAPRNEIPAEEPKSDAALQAEATDSNPTEAAAEGRRPPERSAAVTRTARAGDFFWMSDPRRRNMPWPVEVVEAPGPGADRNSALKVRFLDEDGLRLPAEGDGAQEAACACASAERNDRGVLNAFMKNLTRFNPGDIFALAKLGRALEPEAAKLYPKSSKAKAKGKAKGEAKAKGRRRGKVYAEGGISMLPKMPRKAPLGVSGWRPRVPLNSPPSVVERTTAGEFASRMPAGDDQCIGRGPLGD
eukprot:TRINITY_DN10994_c0_g1_i2.p1 TRINITY_DN10994_c0_g1~~TRINITY_DN10994_c0_g1_i2.p1  ORF type:complete len:769 (+),score=196.28 TRINITY_DN10994_c0_g1_i2:108-2414(+)